MNMNRIVNVKKLKSCSLWHGSMEQIDYEYGGLKLHRVQTRINEMSAANDLTPEELKYLEALKFTLENPLGEIE